MVYTFALFLLLPMQIILPVILLRNGKLRQLIPKNAIPHDAMETRPRNKKLTQICKTHRQ